MDILKFHNLTHREHVICNPTSDEKLTRFAELLRLRTGDRNNLDQASCIGARWILGGHAKTMEALISLLRPVYSIFLVQKS